MPPAGSEPVIPASEQPQTHALNRAANGIDQLPHCTYRPIATLYLSITKYFFLKSKFQLRFDTDLKV